MGELASAEDEIGNSAPVEPVEVENVKEDSDEEDNIRKTSKKRVSQLILDDDSDEETTKEDQTPSETIVDRESSQPAATDASKNPSDPNQTPITMNKLFQQSDLYDAEESDESDAETKTGCKIENLDVINKIKEENEHIKPKTTRKRNAKTKQSIRKEKENSLQLHSETQRMIRQSRVSIPYHIPEQKTLQYFLNRKKNTPAVIKPALIKLEDKDDEEIQPKIDSDNTKEDKNELNSPPKMDLMDFDDDSQDLPDPFAIVEEKKPIPEPENAENDVIEPIDSPPNDETTPEKQKSVKSSGVTPTLVALRLFNADSWTPRLSGSASSVIDLDSTSRNSGLDVFMRRFEDHTLKVNRKSDVKDVNKEDESDNKIVIEKSVTPGAQLLCLKETLHAKIVVKRDIERQKRIDAHQMDNEEGFESGDENEAEIEEEEEMELTDQTDTDEEEEEEEDVVVTKKERKRNVFIDDEADDDEHEDVDDVEGESDGGGDEMSDLEVGIGDDVDDIDENDEISNLEAGIDDGNDGNSVVASKNEKKIDEFDEIKALDDENYGNSFLFDYKRDKAVVDEFGGNKSSDDENDENSFTFDSKNDKRTEINALNTSIVDMNVSDVSICDVSIANTSIESGLGTMITPAQRPIEYNSLRTPERSGSQTQTQKTPSSADVKRWNNVWGRIGCLHDTNSQADYNIALSQFQTSQFQKSPQQKTNINDLLVAKRVENSQEKDDLLALCSGEFGAKTGQSVLKVPNGSGRRSQSSGELLDLCSGEFDAKTGKSVFKVPNRSGRSSQSSGELLNLCSGEFDLIGGGKSGSCKEFAESAFENGEKDDEFRDLDDENEEKIGEKDEKIDFFHESPTKNDFINDECDESDESEDENDFTRKRKRKRIVSDDESDENNEFLDTQLQTDDENDETLVEEADYDENEEPIAKKSVQKRKFSEFFENEAELSGSEASSDEEEREDDDEMEGELGDNDELVPNDDTLRQQVGRTHFKAMADEDAREVRLIKEVLLPDGDLHTDGKSRNRKFKWKGMYENSEEEARMSCSDEENGDGEEEQEEIRRTNERYDREKWLREREEEEEVEVEVVKVKSKSCLKEGGGGGGGVVEAAVPKNFLSPMLISKYKTHRGSFINQHNPDTNNNKLKPSESNTIGIKNSRKFVFATVSPQKQPIPEVKEVSSARKKPKLQRKNLTKKFTEEETSSVFKFL